MSAAICFHKACQLHTYKTPLDSKQGRWQTFKSTRKPYCSAHDYLRNPSTQEPSFWTKPHKLEPFDPLSSPGCWSAQAVYLGISLNPLCHKINVQLCATKAWIVRSVAPTHMRRTARSSYLFTSTQGQSINRLYAVVHSVLPICSTYL